MHLSRPVGLAILLTPVLGFLHEPRAYEESLYARSLEWDLEPRDLQLELEARSAEDYDTTLYARDAEPEHYEYDLYARDAEPYEHELYAREAQKHLMSLADKHAKSTYGTTRHSADKNAHSEFKAGIWSNTHANQVEQAKGKSALNDEKWKAAQTGASLVGGLAGWAKLGLRDAYPEAYYAEHDLYARDAEPYEYDIYARDAEPYEHELYTREAQKHLMSLADKHAKSTYGTTRQSADKNAHNEFKAAVWSNTHANQIEQAKGKSALNDNKWKAAQTGATLVGGVAGWAKLGMRDAYPEAYYTEHELYARDADIYAREAQKHLMALADKHAKSTYGTTRQSADKNAHNEFKAAVWSNTHANQIEQAKGKSALNDKYWKAAGVGATLVGGGAGWAGDFHH